jgi:cysteine desulfurase / selenocysteine lyase
MRQGMRIVYLDHAAMGLPSQGTIAAVSSWIDVLANPEITGTERSLKLFEAVERARQQAASLINVDSANLLLVENTSQGLGLIASSLPLADGDNILVGDIEFLAATVCWRSASRKLRIEIRPVKTQGGRVLPEEFARVADSRTRVLILSSVQEVSGFRCNLRAFGQLAKELKALLIVDGIQEAGALHVDLTKTPVDAYCAGGSKWLRSPFGMGFLYVGPELLSRLSPPTFGYMALKEPEAGWQGYLQSQKRTPFDPLPEQQDARKLLAGGMPNGLGAVALEQAIRDVRGIGTPASNQRILRLTKALITELMESGFRICAVHDPSEENYRSGIVCFGMKTGAGAEKQLLACLLEAKIQVSLRYTTGIGGIRVSLHHDNTDGDIQALMDILRRELRRPRTRVAAPNSTRIDGSEGENSHAN